MSKYGERIDLPLKGTGQWECSHTGEIYKLTNNEYMKCIAN